MKKLIYFKRLKNNFRKILNTIFPILIGVFFIYLTLKDTNKEIREEIIINFKQADYIIILISISMAVISHIIRAIRWRVMLIPMNYNPKTINLILSVFISYISNLAIPRSGEVLRATIVNKYEKIPFSKGFSTIVIERFIDLIILFMIIIFSMILNFELINSFLKIEEFNFITILIILLTLSSSIIFFRIIYKSENQYLFKFKIFLNEFKEGLMSTYKIKKKSYFISLTLLIWILYVGMFYVMKWSMIETANLSLESILLAFTVGALSISISNGGIGIYPYLVSQVFVFYGIEYDASLSFGWILWTSHTIVVIVLGAISFFILPLFNMKSKRH